MRANANVIVVADDDAEIRRAYTILFESKGYEVHACSDGAQAFALCREKHPGIVFLDIEMPVQDGFETARQLRAEPDLADIRVIAVTGSSDEWTSARAWDAGFHDFLAKPAPVSMLLAMIRPTRTIAAIRDI
jgi:CheY-like chemotaxis protein